MFNFNTESSIFKIGGGATALLESCAVINSVVRDKFASAAIFTLNAVDPDDIYAQKQDTVVRILSLLQIVTSQPQVVYAEASGFFSEFDVQVYSDPPIEVVYTGENATYNGSRTLDFAPENRPGIDTNTPWFVDLEQVRFPYPLNAVKCACLQSIVSRPIYRVASIVQALMLLSVGVPVTIDHTVFMHAMVKAISAKRLRT